MLSVAGDVNISSANDLQFIASTVSQGSSAVNPVIVSGQRKTGHFATRK